MKFSWTALLAKVAGGALIGLAPLLGTFFPKQSVLWATLFGSSGVIIFLAGLIYQSLQPAAKIMADAPVIHPDGSPSGATNISSSSALLPVNQIQKGP